VAITGHRLCFMFNENCPALLRFWLSALPALWKTDDSWVGRLSCEGTCRLHWLHSGVRRVFETSTSVPLVLLVPSVPVFVVQVH
jgi:hypothetical protein